MIFRPITLVQHIEEDLPYDPVDTLYYSGIELAADVVAWKEDSRNFPEIHTYILPEPVSGLDEIDITGLSPVSIKLNDAGLNEPLKNLAAMTLPTLIRYLR